MSRIEDGSKRINRPVEVSPKAANETYQEVAGVVPVRVHLVNNVVHINDKGEVVEMSGKVAPCPSCP
jgi:hypothetical protein